MITDVAIAGTPINFIETAESFTASWYNEADKGHSVFYIPREFAEGKGLDKPEHVQCEYMSHK